MSADITLTDGIAWYVVFLFSTTLHEASHALVALKLGDDTAHRGGQVTLDPIPHIQREPFGMVLVPIVTYFLSGWMMGWASAPYDPQWARRFPRRSALMAMAGPASNLALCLLAAILMKLGIHFGWFNPPGLIHIAHVVAPARVGVCSFAALILSITFSLNLLLFAFNLIPLPPLDGASVPLLFLSDSTGEKYTAFMRAPGMAMVGLILSWQIFNAVFPPIHHFAITLLYPGMYSF